MNTHLSFHSPYLKRVYETIKWTIAGMSEEQMTWSPEGKWSAALILEHLSLAFYRTVQAGKAALKEPEHKVRRRTWKERLLVWLFVEITYFPVHVQAPKMVLPRGVGPRQAKELIATNLIQMDDVLQQCGEKFGTNVPCLVHSVLGPLTIRQWRRFHFLHTRHHMRQIHRLRMRLAQPGAAKQARKIAA